VIRKSASKQQHYKGVRLPQGSRFNVTVDRTWGPLNTSRIKSHINFSHKWSCQGYSESLVSTEKRDFKLNQSNECQQRLEELH
jgi:hypothetical protein